MLKKKENINLNTTCQNNPTKFARNFTLGEKRIRKKCLGCCDTFTCYQSKNYNYCLTAVDISKANVLNVAMASGLIKFSNQPPYSCKLCYLVRQEKEEENIFAKYA